MLGRIYPRGFCTWSHSSKAQQRGIDTFLSYKAVSRCDHPQNGGCPNPFCPLFLSLYHKLLPFLSAHGQWALSAARQSGLQWGYLAANNQTLGDGELVHSVCSSWTKGILFSLVLVEEGARIPWLLHRAFPSFPPSRSCSRMAMSSAFQANCYHSSNYTWKIAASLVVMEFSICMLTLEGTNSETKVWGGFFGMYFAILLEDEF